MEQIKQIIIMLCDLWGIAPPGPKMMQLLEDKALLEECIQFNKQFSEPVLLGMIRDLFSLGKLVIEQETTEQNTLIGDDKARQLLAMLSTWAVLGPKKKEG